MVMGGNRHLCQPVRASGREQICALSPGFGRFGAAKAPRKKRKALPMLKGWPWTVSAVVGRIVTPIAFGAGDEPI